MSKQRQKHDKLPKHQKKIVLCLAKEGTMTISETNKKIKGEYTSTNRAFHELEGKLMIEKIDVIEYRGRHFPKYWLTVRGSGFALLNNVNPEKVRLNALKSSKNSEEEKAIEVYFKLRKTSTKMANILDRFILLEGKLEPAELFKQLLPEMVTMNEDQLQELFRVGKKTDYWKHFEETMKHFTDEIKKVLSHE